MPDKCKCSLLILQLCFLSNDDEFSDKLLRSSERHSNPNRCEIVDNTWGAMWRVAKDSYVKNSHFANKKIDMGLQSVTSQWKTAPS